MDTGNELDPDKQVCKILELPHYVLRILLSYLDSTSLYLLSKTCSYLKEAVEDPALWKHVDARGEPNSNEKINYVTEKIHEKTVHVLLRGYKKYTNIPQTLFDRIDPFENLKVLALENVKLYGSKVSLKDFPSCLEELSLRRSYVKNSVYFFQHSAKKMYNLRVLILDECSWVTCSFLLSVSKFENLEIISAVKCLRAHLNMMPYLNVAKYGCKKLKILDFRFTGIGGELLRTFYSKSSIQRMYFQSYKSAQVDYEEKINSNAKVLSRRSIDMNTDLNISDSSLHDYSTTTAANSIEPITKSMLYQDPYPECECGYKNSDEERIMPEPTIYSLEDDNDTYGPPAHTTAKFVCQKHMKDVEKLPNDFKDFFVIHQKQFHSDITSDTDSSDSDSSGGSDDPACCIYAMGTKMVILPNVHEPNNRSEMDLPCRDGSRNLVPFNIFIVNPFDARNNRQQNAESSSAINQPGPSGAGGSNNTSTATVRDVVNNDNGECSTVNKIGCEKRKLDDSDSEADDESTNKKRKITDGESGSEMVGSKYSDKRDSEIDSHEKKTSKDKQANSGTHHGSVEGISSKTIDETVQKSVSVDIENQDAELEENKNERECGCSVEPDSKKVTGNTTRLNKYDSDSESDTEKDKMTTPTGRQKRKGKRFSDSGDRICGKKKCSMSVESQIDTGNVNEEPHSARLEDTNDRASEQSQEIADDQRPSTSSAENASAETGTPNRRDNAVPNREPPAVDQLAGVARARPDGRNLQWVFGGVGGHHPMQAQVRLEGWPLPNNKISLRRISLRGYKKVTHMALLYLRYLQIELIDLTYTSVTKREIENFLLYNPNCRVIHPLYCVCKPRNPF